MSDEDNGNGQSLDEIAEGEAFKGALLNARDMKREDGILTRGLSSAQSGVLQRAMTAEKKDEDYRQELKTAFFLTTDEADNWVKALNECDRYGCSRKLNIDWLIARNAGIQGGRFKAILEAITHTVFQSNVTGQKKNHWWSNKGGNNQGSAISS